MTGDSIYPARIEMTTEGSFLLWRSVLVVAHRIRICLRRERKAAQWNCIRPGA